MMNAHRRQLCLFTISILATLLIAGSSHAATVWRANWRLEGYVGQAPAETKTEAHIVLQYKGQDHAFDLTKAVVISGHGSLDQLLHDIQPHQMKMILQGPAEAIGVLLKASPGTRLLIFAHHDSGSRYLHVTKVNAAPPTSEPALK